ncbi:MAG: NAD(P) transhydrogenase subunit alpha [Gammaproteobacteria bacterium]|nr:NAD(P) transhydrogenase subunit alpha [Gammaproteobacteria bacterium]
MLIGLLKETLPGERRVALVPAQLALLAKQRHEVLVERDAGAAAGYPDADYLAAGARIVERSEVLAGAEILATVRGSALAEAEAAADFARIRATQILIGLCEPLAHPAGVQRLATTGATVFALELLPRTSRAQAMDVLSSMANLAGYKAVLMAANQVPRILPMMTTAAGTLTAAKVLVLGAGVAGLQAVATAKRLGAAVDGYDIRPEVAEQIRSVGGKFVDLGLSAEADQGGYAKAQSADFIARQQEALAQFVRAADIVITTAQVPGRKAPVLITAAMQKGMKPGSVVVDLAAESGGNCELTQCGKNAVVDGVTMMGPANLISELAFHASQLYSRNIINFILNLTTREGALADKENDDIVRETRAARGGEISSERVKQALGST